MKNSATSIPAVFCNRFYLNAAPDRVRIAFAEVVNDSEVYHQATSMSIDNAIELAQMIMRMAVEQKAREAGPQVGVH